MNQCTIASCHGKPVCHECKALGYSPEESPLDMNATLLAIKDALPKGSRLSACGTIAVITLGDDIPDPADLDAGVRFLRAMKRVKGEYRLINTQSTAPTIILEMSWTEH